MKSEISWDSWQSPSMFPKQISRRVPPTHKCDLTCAIRNGMRTVSISCITASLMVRPLQHCPFVKFATRRPRGRDQKKSKTIFPHSSRNTDGEVWLLNPTRVRPRHYGRVGRPNINVYIGLLLVYTVVQRPMSYGRRSVSLKNNRQNPIKKKI